MSEFDLAAIRGAAFELHNMVNWRNHPCRNGCGRCCEGKTPVNRLDEEVLGEAIESGKIKAKVVRSAQQRVKNGTKKCGFLNEKKECSVYQYRPGICAATGAGGIPNEAFPETKTAVENYLRTGINETIPLVKLVSSMCQECASVLVERETVFSAKTVAAYSLVIMYYGGLAPARPINSYISTLRQR